MCAVVGGHVLAEGFLSTFGVSCVLHSLLKLVSPDVMANRKVVFSLFPGSGSVRAPPLIGTAVCGGMKLKHFLLNDSEVICAIPDYFSFS